MLYRRPRRRPIAAPPMNSLDFSIWLALVACVVGGVRGGLILAAEKPVDAPAGALVEDRRLIGVAILAAHAGTAAVLGYGSALGHGMALALGLAWVAVSGTRFWGARKLGHRPPGAVVELLTGLVLILPAWADLARLSRGAII